MESSPNDDSLLLGSMADLGWIYSEEPNRAEGFDDRVLATSSAQLGAQHPITLAALSRLANKFRGQRRFQAAEEMQVQALWIRERVLGADHQDTLTSMTNLAVISTDQGRLNEAEELQVKVLETQRRVLGAEFPSMLTNMRNLVNTFTRQGRSKKAEETIMPVLEIEKRVLGGEISPRWPAWAIWRRHSQIRDDTTKQRRCKCKSWGFERGCWEQTIKTR